MNRLRIAFVPGDPGGIGPELTVKVLSSPPPDVDILLVGDEKVVTRGEQTAGARIDRTPVAGDSLSAAWPAHPHPLLFLQQNGASPEEIAPGSATAAGGRASLRELECAVDLAARGIVDGVCFAPLNKQAMKLGGMDAQDELHHLAGFLGFSGCLSEINITDAGVWTSRVTSHVPLRRVPDLIDREKIKASARLLSRALREYGVPSPQIAVAALNPHGGDGGNFGREEIDIIAPAVKELREEGMRAAGPYPADTLFRRVLSENIHGVVTMYHDQGQIALKLQGFERGVSVLGGLPVAVATPAHGTAYDIAGRNAAFTGATEAALHVVIRMAAQKRERARGQEQHEN